MRINRRIACTIFLTTTLVACSSGSDNAENVDEVVPETSDTQTMENQLPPDNTDDDANESVIQDDSADQPMVDDGVEVSTSLEGETETEPEETADLDDNTNDAGEDTGESGDSTNTEVPDMGANAGDSGDDTNAEVSDSEEATEDSGDNNNEEVSDSGQVTQSDISANESTDNSGSVINAANYISLLRTGLTISRSDISPFDRLIDAGEFTGNSSESVANQPCLAAGTYDLTVTPHDNPGGEDQGFINLPRETYDFTTCSSIDGTTITGFYEFSESLSGGFTFSDIELSETINGTISGVATPAGLKDVTINGTLQSFIFGSDIGTSFDLDSYAASDANGTLEVTGTGTVLEVDFMNQTNWTLDMTLKGPQINPENPSVQLTLKTEEFQDGVSRTLRIINGSIVSDAVVVLSAPDGSSVRAAPSSNESVADVTLASEGSVTLDSRPWSELVPQR